MGVRELIQEALNAPRKNLPSLALAARAAIGRGETLEAAALCRTVLSLSVSLASYDSGHADLVRWLVESCANSAASLDYAARFAVAVKDESLEALVRATKPTA